jgi:hypothetical protein
LWPTGIEEWEGQGWLSWMRSCGGKVVIHFRMIVATRTRSRENADGNGWLFRETGQIQDQEFLVAMNEMDWELWRCNSENIPILTSVFLEVVSKISKKGDRMEGVNSRTVIGQRRV